MNESTPIKEDRMAALSGLGTSRKRVEDARFTQGKGNYVDDMKLPGMLFGDFVRSPYAHARIKSINTEAALAIPGVHAVLTAADLEPLGFTFGACVYIEGISEELDGEWEVQDRMNKRWKKRIDLLVNKDRMCCRWDNIKLTLLK